MFTDDYHFIYGESNGTSYATPLVAGTAALWLARWGAELDVRYPLKWQRVEAFLHVLRKTAQVPSGWDTQRHGAGVLDAAAAINCELPDVNLLSIRISGATRGSGLARVVRTTAGAD
jgi:hypothetical protein